MQFDDTCLAQPSDLTEALAEQLRTKQQLDTAKTLMLEAEVRYWEAVEAVERVIQEVEPAKRNRGRELLEKWKEGVRKGKDPFSGY